VKRETVQVLTPEFATIGIVAWFGAGIEWFVGVPLRLAYGTFRFVAAEAVYKTAGANWTGRGNPCTGGRCAGCRCSIGHKEELFR